MRFISAQLKDRAQFAALLLFLLPTLLWAQESGGDTSRVRSGSVATQSASQTKNPNAAVLRSLLIPGWGQYYNGKKLKAAVVFLAEAGEVGTAVYWHQQASAVTDKNFKLYYQDNRNLALWFLAGTIVLSMLDAYVDAHLADFDESPSLESHASEGGIAAPPLFALRVKIRL